MMGLSVYHVMIVHVWMHGVS